MIYNPSITQYERTEAFELQVARGMIAGHSLVNVFGYQALIDGTSICVWENNSAYIFPINAVQMSLVSTSELDVAVTKLITGLDANYNVVTEAIVVNGLTPVLTINSYLRINNVRTIAGNALAFGA